MAEIVHRKKLFGGRETAQQVHAELAWYGKTCAACDGPPAIRIQVFVLLSDLDPARRAAVLFEVGMGRQRILKLAGGDGVKASDIAACALHIKGAEHAAAGAPSWAIIEIDRGPGVDNPVVGVVSSIA